MTASCSCGGDGPKQMDGKDDMISSDERIATLRQRCLSRRCRVCHRQEVAAAQAMRDTAGIASWQVRVGLRTRSQLSAIRFAVDDLELVMGRMSPEGPTEAELCEARGFLKDLPSAGGQSGHCQLDLSQVFEVGLDDMAADLRRRLAAAAGHQAETYQSFLCALEGFERMLENAAEAAEAAMAEQGDERRDDLAEMAASCRRIAHCRPETFLDGLHMVWLADFALMAIGQASLVVPGHLDRVLWPLYQADTERGALTRERALVLLECTYLLINELVADGLAMSVMVGGRDAEGNDVSNELSYLCMEALRRTRLIYPTVGLCWHEGTPPALTALTLELIADGCATPAFFGDETVQKGLRRLGCPPRDACNYINSTCVEITPVGGSNVWVASPYFNTCGLLLEELAAQVASGPAATFEQFLAAYRRRLAAKVDAEAAEQNRLRRLRRAHGRKPLQSLLTRACIQRGRDIDDGGAEYNWVECSFVGVANLADSLQAIRQEVYERGRLRLAELKAALDRNFGGNESLRRRLLQGCAKYGNQCRQVDSLVAGIVDFCVACCERQRMEPDGSPFVPGMFTWVMHQRLGSVTGATPDGRLAGEPFADGAGPAQGRERRGPTAAILSTVSWDHSRMIGGLAYNMKFSRGLLRTPEARRRLGDLVAAYLRLGGFETQINVVDASTLRKAMASPEQYRDLVVRIGGYCDYFTRQTPEMQEEIAARTEFELGC